MGFDTDRFINFDAEASNDLICPICTNVLENPVMTDCEHVYCNLCLNQWMQGNVTCRCPVCNTSVDGRQLKSAPRVTRNMLSNLTIKCDNNGCLAQVKLENLHNHKNHCIYGNHHPLNFPELRAMVRLPISNERAPLLPEDGGSSCCANCVNGCIGVLLHILLVFLYEIIFALFTSATVMGAMFYNDCDSMGLPVELILLGIAADMSLVAYIFKRHVPRFANNRCRAICIFKFWAILQGAVICMQVFGMVVNGEPGKVHFPPVNQDCNPYLWAYVVWGTTSCVGSLVLYFGFFVLKAICVFLFS